MEKDRLNSLLPPPPWAGPPLPKILGQKWPWAAETQPSSNPIAIVPIEDIIALHKKGLPPAEIAARLKTTYYAVQSKLYRAGFTPHPPAPRVPKRPPPVVEQEEIVALHKVGLSPSEIGARLDVSHGLIRMRLLRAGLKPNPHPVWGEAKERIGDIVGLHREGFTPGQIAKRLGLSDGLVRKRLREAELAPEASAEEVTNTLRGLEEIIGLAKESVPRYEIAKRTGSAWPLVAEALEGSSVRSVVPACGEITAWLLSLLPIIDEIKEAHPNTEAIVKKVDELEKELVAISDAAWTVEHRLPWKGKEAEEERWCVADISQAVGSNLDYMEALKGCVKQLDIAKLPRPLEQADTCIKNITTVLTGAISQATRR